MKNLLTTISIFLTVLFSNGQTSDMKIERDYIQVTGESEMLIVPDEIYVRIIISERYQGREKITVDSIEQQMKVKLNELEIDLKNITLSEANADYIRVRWSKKDVLTSKDYLLKLETAAQVSKVFEEFAKINIQDLSIQGVNNTKIEDYKKEVKINAAKAAKAKATYLLTAMGQQIGKALRVEEVTPSVAIKSNYSGLNIRGSRSDGTAYYIDGVKMKEKQFADEVSFSKIKLEYKINATFEIK